MKQLGDLPTEILLNIVKFLPIKNVEKLSNTSKYYHCIYLNQKINIYKNIFRSRGFFVFTGMSEEDLTRLLWVFLLLDLDNCIEQFKDLKDNHEDEFEDEIDFYILNQDYMEFEI
jgi:hypothetical protein